MDFSSKFIALFACMFHDYSWKSYVYWTISLMLNIRKDLCATINPPKIKDLEEQKQFLKHSCNINLIGFLEKTGSTYFKKKPS